MKYTVVWKPSAERHLAELWLDENIRPDVARIADELDRLLRRNPEEVGESRSDRQRIVLSPPLAAIFEVKPDDLIVNVLAVWRIDPA